MNILSIKKTLVILNATCMLLIVFLNRIMSLAFDDSFVEVYEFVKKIDPGIPANDSATLLLLIGFLSYLAGLYFAFKEKSYAKLLLTIGTLALIFSGIYSATTSLIFIDYAPAVAFRYLFFFLTGCLLVILHLEESGHFKKLSDE